jgi:lipopolysaccharide export system protein LptA
MKKPNANLRLVFAFALLAASGSSLAELADRDKPVNLVADNVTVDDAKQISIYQGNVTLTQGTLLIRGDKLVVKQDAQGFQHGTAYGNPASFRQKREGLDEYVEGYASRIEYDGNTDKLQLFTNARMKRNDDEVRGSYIAYDGKTEFFEVVGGPKDAGAGSGRVHAVIQPKKKPAAPPPAAPSVPLQPSGSIDAPRE